MKTLVEGKDIIEAIKLLKGENSIINAKGNKTELITTEITKDNGVITLIKELDGTIKNEGSIIIQNDILKLVKKGEVTIENKSITFGKRKVSFAEQECDYKGVNCEGDKLIELSKQEYEHLISGMYAISKEVYRPVIKKVSFEGEENKLRTVTCDGYRLAIRKLDRGFKYNAKFLINEYILKVLSKIKFKTVELILSENKHDIIFKTDNGYTLTSQLYEGNYIEVDKFISYETVFTGKININDMYEVVNSYSKEVKFCKMEFNESELTLKAKENNYSLEDKLNVEFDSISPNGSDLMVAYNPRYLLDTLKCFKGNKESETLSYSTNSGVSIALFKLDDNTIDGILPIRLPKEN